jgi:serine/threonine protein kinase
LDVAVHPEQPGMRGAAIVDETPTQELLPGPRQVAITGPMRVELAPGTVLRSRYILQNVIGRGGSSIIYRARDLYLAQSRELAADFVAIKVLRTEQRTDPLAIGRLRREYRQMRRLSHPGIVRVFDLDSDADVWFISMVLVEGLTLQAWLEKPGNTADGMRIIGACCEALEYVHSLGILHGDLKATNVMVTHDKTAKLIDFGSVASLDSRVADGSDLARVATPLYASPQILAGKIAEQRDDIYSLACLSYAILSGGRHPFGGRPSLEDGRAKMAPTRVSAIPAALFEVIERGLSVERERRQASVQQFQRELVDADQRCRAHATSVATPARNIVGEVRRPESAVHAANKVSRSTVPAIARNTGFTAQACVSLGAVALAIVGIAAWVQLGRHGDASHIPEILPVAVASSPVLVAAEPAQSQILPETRSSQRDSGAISFEASTVHVSAMQSMVAITVNRQHASRNGGAFVWRVQPGTARPGVDYVGIEPQVVRFHEGQVTRTLFIPLISIPPGWLSRGPRAFTVALEQVAGGPALGQFARVTVAIIPPPTSSPFSHSQAHVEDWQTRVASAGVLAR